MLLLFFETIEPDERTSVMTTFNLANALATAAGALLGGGLLAVCGKTQQIYLLLFALSSAARALTLIALVQVPRFSRPAVGLGGASCGAIRLDEVATPARRGEVSPPERLAA